MLVEAEDPSWLGVTFFLVGIAVFALSAWPLAPAPFDIAEPRNSNRPRPGRGATLILITALPTAVALNVGALYVLWPMWRSALAVALWGMSILVVAFAGVALRRVWEWPARWGVGVAPHTRTGRAVLVITVIGLLGLAAAARLLWLHTIPLGINPDEGDRASTAIQILRGQLNLGIFDYGWFGINILYFWVLGQVMKVAGITFAGARVLGGLSGILTVAAVIWIGIRHFGYRVGVMAGGLLAVLGIALQFGRETTEATPTALLWTLSVAGLLEAARRGRSAAWIFAGIAGGLSIYFYPTGRMWPALAALFSLYLLIHGVGGRRLNVACGVSAAAIAALLVVAPFLLRSAATNWESFTVRARMTSIFVPENRARLEYYEPEWSMPHLLQVQMQRAIGIFNRYPDRNGFWPTNRPLMQGLLAVLTLVGLGWVCLRPRDPRFMLLAIWFWMGLIGVIVTVETPNVQRMGSAIPAAAFFPALVLDSLVRRAQQALPLGSATTRLRLVPAALAMLIVGILMVQQWRFYFLTYGPMDEWSGPTLMGKTVAAQGDDTQVFSLGRQHHISNQGWVRLLAPNTPRGGLPSPGAELPIALPAEYNLAFMVMPQQPYYYPYLKELYPNGSMTPAADHGNLLFHIYRVSKAQRAATLGAFAVPPGGTPVRVQQLGEAPPGWTTYPSRMRWTATWRVSQYWNYALRIGPGPARLMIDGSPVLEVGEGRATARAEVSLAQGDHFVDYDGWLAGPGKPAQFEWAVVRRSAPNQAFPLDWRGVAPGTLWPAHGPTGLFGVVRSAGRAAQHRLDGTLAFGNLTADTTIGGRPFVARWTGTLHVPTTGSYAMTMFAQGPIEVRIDDHPVISSDAPTDPIETSVELAEGPHAVAVSYRVNGGGALEWTWTPPGGERSIVPRSVLTPPPGIGVGPPVPPDVLGPPEQMPVTRAVQVGL